MIYILSDAFDEYIENISSDSDNDPMNQLIKCPNKFTF